MISQKRLLLLTRINKIGAFITTTEADRMIDRFQQQYPNEPGSYLYDSSLFQQLLNVPGCEGIRVINGIHEDEHTLIFAAVSHVNRNLPQPAPVIGKGTALPFEELSQIIAEPVTGVGTTHGTIISREEGREIIATYQATQPGTTKSSLYGRELFESLLSIEGCTSIRVCNAIDDDGDRKVILIPLNKDNTVFRNIKIGNTIFDPPIGNKSLQCPPYCPAFEFIIL